MMYEEWPKGVRVESKLTGLAVEICVNDGGDNQFERNFEKAVTVLEHMHHVAGL
jgi:hypothetical protein